MATCGYIEKRNVNGIQKETKQKLQAVQPVVGPPLYVRPRPLQVVIWTVTQSFQVGWHCVMSVMRVIVLYPCIPGLQLVGYTIHNDLDTFIDFIAVVN